MSEKKEKVRPAVLYDAVTRAINRDESSRLPEYPYRYYVCRENDGTRLVYQEHGDRQLKLVAPDKVIVPHLLRYTADCLTSEAFRWTVKQVAECVDYWQKYTKPVPKPRFFGFTETPQLVIQRLPWRKDIEKKGTPYFDELLARVDNAAALKKWIGSIFFESSDVQTYCWCYGGGGDGKGALTRFLADVLGPAYSSEEPPSPESRRFWTAGLMGKRLVAFNDCNNIGFPASGLFKSLTGGDHIRVEQKFAGSFTTKLNLKFMYTSNDVPNIGTGDSDQRRIILCNFGKANGLAHQDYQKRLWDEGNEFIIDCIEAYQATNSDHSPILADRVKSMAVASTNEEEFEVALESSFQKDPDAQMQPRDFQAINQRIFKARKDQLNFVKYLERVHGIIRKSVRVDGEPKYMYVGIKQKAFSSFASNVTPIGGRNGYL